MKALARFTLLLALSTGAALHGYACSRGQAEVLRAKGTRAKEPIAIVESVYDGALGKDWNDWGWAPRELGKGAAKLDLSSYGGWIIARSGEHPRYGALTFRYKAPRAYGEFLEVRVESNTQSVMPRVVVRAEHRVDVDDEWSEVLLPMKTLNPEALPWDRIVFRAQVPVPKGNVELDKIGFTKAGAVDVPPPPLAIKEAPLTIFLAGAATAIKPMIYGIAYDPRLDAQSTHQFELGATARRWGGNAATRFNWELDAWNSANDWFFENLSYTGGKGGWAAFLESDLDRNLKSALTIPTLGWVAKDRTSVSFPVSIYGKQRQIDPYRPDAGDGFGLDGKPIAPGAPARTSVAFGPDGVKKWVQAIRALDDRRGARSVHLYFLDNEPMLWNSTHRDVHPDPVGYDELLDRIIKYGTAIRAADPDATIAGPCLWGWPAYLFSAKDAVAGFQLKPDRIAHGDVPLLPWVLRKVREHEKKTGTRILDVVDVHFYPQAERVGGANGGIDAATSALRLRQTHGLWDPTYLDESWIGDTVKLVPRLKQWIAENAPGLGISIGEWNFGAETHGSGGAAVAEALGVFGRDGVDAAFYWTYPPKNSPAFWAFRAYRNFDGHGARFLDWSIPATASEGVSLFASRDASSSHVVAVLVDERGDRPARPVVRIQGCVSVTDAKAYRYTPGDNGFTSVKPKVDGCTLTLDRVEPWGLAVLDVHVETKP